ncbi:glycosyltransferase [Streptantibioticus cattleyicolor]|uniref:Putative cytoplasmic protein n=1 Tax=Streptantibioticus cattleyicolor (strain ATCC 35852 / DSM 46488 / JCM 4925 / NBRC 14057 / NRRL 8057) TaxID=1003195 RepID=F8JM80_STREN|nr:glycosyltransferase [Streptantibioticus cattleyicolor]AEW99388.1 putative cytoplasmic protein [Streptantibioticus cattleyicolor NRRL 8057 = DSM 46488]CCB71570.1 putative glycosyltransferase [Streptantibioticus cattleyicolor NRRL 8057 = DSM 46488]
MRILFTAHPSYSHLAPVVLPVALAAREAGHEVAVATGPDLTGVIEERGLTALPLPGMRSLAEAVREAQVAGAGIELPLDRIGRVTVELDPAFFARGFAGLLAGRSARDLLTAAESWKPDLLLRESTEYGGYLAAERLGLAHGALDIAPMAPYAHPLVAEEVNRQRAELDLAPVADPWHPMRGLRAAVVPEAFYPASDRLPHTRHYRTTAPAAAPLDPHLAELPDDRPLVLATLGSNASRLPGSAASGLLDVIVRALAGLPVTAVVALGPGVSPLEWTGTRAGNVHLVSFAPQELLLRSCDLFITHAGFNGVRESLGAGVPMVAVPMFAEQSANASRLEELGVARRLNVEDVTEESLSTAVRAVLDDPGFRHRAKGLQRRIDALPPLSGIVADLRTLAD